MWESQWSNVLDHKGGRQLMPKQLKRMFETIDTYGIMSDQPRFTQITDLGDSAKLIYFPEVRKDNIRSIHHIFDQHGQIAINEDMTVPKLLAAILKEEQKSSSGMISQKDLNYIADRKRSVLLVGVSYPANPLLLIPDIRGNYMISTSGYEQEMTAVNQQGDMKKRITHKEMDRLVKDAIYLFQTPLKQLKQFGSYPSNNRYYISQMTHEGKKYGQGFSVDRWNTAKENKELGLPNIGVSQLITNILLESLDTNGHIFFVIGNQRILRQQFDSINAQVIG